MDRTKPFCVVRQKKQKTIEVRELASVRCSEEERRLIKEDADRHDRTISDTVRVAMALYLSREAQDKAIAAQRELVAAQRELVAAQQELIDVMRISLEWHRAQNGTDNFASSKRVAGFSLRAGTTRIDMNKRH